MTTGAAAPLKTYGIALNGLFERDWLEPEAIRALRRNLERKAIRHASDPTSEGGSVCQKDPRARVARRIADC